MLCFPVWPDLVSLKVINTETKMRESDYISVQSQLRDGAEPV